MGYSDDLKVIHGQGMPSPRHHEPGDLFIKLAVKFPEFIAPEAIKLLEGALPPRTPIETFPTSIMQEEVELDEVDPAGAMERFKTVRGALTL